MTFTEFESLKMRILFKILFYFILFLYYFLFLLFILFFFPEYSLGNFMLNRYAL